MTRAAGRAAGSRRARCCGPEPIQRRSLQIFVRLTATDRSAPDASTSPSRAPCASKWSRARVSGSPVRSASSSITRSANPAGVLMPVPTAVPPSGTSARRGRLASTRSMPTAHLRGVPAELLPERHGRRVHQVRAARLHHVGMLARRGLESGGEVVEGRQQVARDSSGGCQVDRGGERVVAGLRGVDVVVRVHRAAERLGGKGRDHLVGVHVRRRARTGLEHVHREVVVEPAVRDGVGRLLDRGGHVGVEHAELAVGVGGRRLDAGQGGDVAGVEGPSG